MTEYQDAEVVAFVQSIEPLLPNDLGRLAVNTARMQFDAFAMGYAASRAKHLRELRDELGVRPLPPIDRPFEPGPRPTPTARGPLATFPSDVKMVTLPWTPPQSRDFLRGDAWGITLPGAPWVPGASTRHPERVLSWFIDRYDAEWQARYLHQTIANSYTHVKLSAGDSMGPVDNGRQSPPGHGQSLEQFVETCLKVKAVVPYVQVMLHSKYFHPWNMALSEYAAIFDPIVQALIDAKAVDELVPGWEWNIANHATPGRTTIDIFKHVGQMAHAAGASCWLHFSPEKTSWFKDKDPRGRFGFYDDLGADVDGLNYQTEPTWSIRDMQDRLVDTLHQFGTQGNRHKLRLDEDQAALMWDHDRPNEDDANLRGFCACCTVDDVKRTDAKVWGFGNGGRRPDGSAI